MVVRTGALALIVLFGLVCPVAAQPWYDHYERAERALDQEDWTRVVTEITQAIQQKGDSATRVRTYGMRFESYFPYLKLGIAYHQLGQVEEALQAFDTEERLGAIAGSADDFDELERFRALAGQALATRREEEASRVAEIIGENLQEATRLTQEGELDAAMISLGRALAVDPEHGEANVALLQLQGLVAEREARREEDRQVAGLVSSGNLALEDGRLREASRAFRRALALRPDEAVQGLLTTTMTRLRTAMVRAPAAVPAPGADTTQPRVRAVIIAGLREAEALEAAGRLVEALDELQAVLALQPSHERAAALQVRILDRQSRADRAQMRREAIDTLVTEMAAAREAEEFEGVLSIANRLLARDPGNSTALGHVAEAFGVMSARLLGTPPRENLPPAIRFADFRQEMDDGLQVQVMRSPAFQMSGVVIDDSPVELRVTDSDDHEIETTLTSQTVGDYTLSEFTLAHPLASGTTTFGLVATDAAGLISSSEYVVVYKVPFFRAFWFYSLCTVAVLALGGLVQGRRVQRRRRLLTRRYNPYVAGAPVLDTNMFFGREALIDRILQTVHNNSLLLYGERRIGKTSLQHQLKRRLESLQDPTFVFYPVFIDLQGTPEERFFATLAEETFQELEPHLGGLQPSGDFTEPATYAYREFLHDMRHILRTLKQKNSKQIKIVLLIDEVDELNRYDPRVNQKLRSFFMKTFAESLTAVVSGVQIRKHWELEGSPWYNFFEEIEVGAFSRAYAVELITRPIQGVFRLEQGVVDRIITLTDCKPYLIQRLCVALINRLHETNRRTATVVDVDAIGRPEEA